MQRSAHKTTNFHAVGVDFIRRMPSNIRLYRAFLPFGKFRSNAISFSNRSTRFHTRIEDTLTSVDNGIWVRYTEILRCSAVLMYYFSRETSRHIINSVSCIVQAYRYVGSYLHFSNKLVLIR